MARPLRSWSVAVGAGPDELEAFLSVHLDQGGVDGSWEARIVQLDREVVALALFGGFLPGDAEFNCSAVEAEMRTLVGRIIDPLDARFDVEVESLDRTGEAVLGQTSTVFLRRSC